MCETGTGREVAQLYDSCMTQSHLSDNTQHSRQKDIYASGGIRTRTIPASERPQTHPLDSSATGKGQIDAYTIHNPMAWRHSENCTIIAIMQSKWFRHWPLQVTCSTRDTLKWISMLCLVVLVLRVAVGFGIALKGCHCRSSQLCMVLDLHSWLLLTTLKFPQAPFCNSMWTFQALL
jgi:hypothetical protein